MTYSPSDSDSNYDHFLEKEEALRRMNNELELKNRQLMKNVASVIQNPKSKLWDVSTCSLSSLGNNGDGLIDVQNLDSRLYEDDDPLDFGPFKISNKPERLSTLGSKSTRSTRSLTGSMVNLNKKGIGKTPRRDSVDTRSTGEPKDLSSDSLVRLLRTKVSLLQNELTLSQKKLMKKSDEIRLKVNESKQLDDEKQRILMELSVHKDKLKKQEMATAGLVEKLRVTDMENDILKKEVNTLKIELKKVNLLNSGSDSRFNKAKEEIERLKDALKVANLQHKETRDILKGKTDDFNKSLKKMEKEKADIMKEVKKQAQLIENLRNQRDLYEAKSAVAFTEEEFLKYLDWRPDTNKK